ncbi:MAG: MMPL family transporter [Gammaproteobacteria bacterium]
MSRLETALSVAIGWWISRVARAPRAVVLSFVVIAVGSVYYASQHLGMDTDRADMLSAELPFRQDYETYKRAFPQYVDTLLLVIESDTPELARAAADRVANKLKRTNTLFRTVSRPGAGAFFDRHAFLYLDVPELRQLADDLAQVQPFLGTLAQDQSLRGLQQMLTQALNAVDDGEKLDLSPLLKALETAIEAQGAGRFHRLSWQGLMLGNIASDSGARQFILAQPRLDYGNWLPAAPAMNALEGLKHAMALDGSQGVTLRITGAAALEYDEMQSVARGAGTGAVVSLALVILVLLAGMRSPRMVAASVATLLASLIITAGFAAVAIGHLNLISVAFAVMNIGLGADYAIHLCLRCRELNTRGAEQSAVLRTAVSHVGTSLALAAATTAVGFFAFVPTAYAGVSELGLIAGAGVFISLITSLSLLPALLTLFPSRASGDILSTWSGPESSGPASFGRYTDAVAAFPRRHARAIRRTALALAAVAALSLPFASFDYNPLNLRDPDSESVATFQDLVDSDDTPPWSISVLEPDATAAATVAERLRELPSVSRAVSLPDHVPARQVRKLAIIDDMRLIMGLTLMTGAKVDPPSYAEQRAALEDFQAALARHLHSGAEPRWPALTARLRADIRRLLDDLSDGTQVAAHSLAALDRSLLATLPDTLNVLDTALKAGPVGFKVLPPPLAAQWRAPGGAYRVEAFPKDDLGDSEALRQFVAQVSALAPHATGLPVISLKAGEAVVAAFQQAFVTSLLVIAVLLLLLMRGPRDALLVLAPLLLGGALTGAVVTLSGHAFNFANIIALPLLLGIGVDNGIHMMHRLRSQPGSYATLLRTSTARAVFYSALTTIVSFGSLAFSAHPGTASLGFLLTVGVLLTLGVTLIVLPALLSWRQDPP